MRPVSIALCAALFLLLAACEKTLEPPYTPGVCFHLVTQRDGRAKFNVLATGQRDLEHCAAELEKMRLSFRALGVNQGVVVGSYQGQFLFLQREGVFTAQNYTGYRYPFLIRGPGGELVKAGGVITTP